MKNIYEFWLTACVYFEARGEDIEGQAAVVHVVLNRSIQREQSVIDVIQAEKQFSWYNGGSTPAIEDWQAFVACMDAVDLAISQRYEGQTLQGANHYHADWMSEYPYWSDEFSVVAHVGGHIFYRG